MALAEIKQRIREKLNESYLFTRLDAEYNPHKICILCLERFWTLRPKVWYCSEWCKQYDEELMKKGPFGEPL